MRWPARAGICGGSSKPRSRAPIPLAIQLRIEKELAGDGHVDAYVLEEIAELYESLGDRAKARSYSRRAAQQHGKDGWPGLRRRLPATFSNSYSRHSSPVRMAGMAFAAELESPLRSTATPDVAILSYEPGVVDTEMQLATRSKSQEEFPWVETFRGFAAQGALVAPDSVVSN